ncbi:zinc finger, RING/FYVE/PHD-type [Artemisia annua]|uniref:RING-type E3 ubiquitin transferase n=1 Tax=Artemisia annua TaxID=35608 RepID=A0A2U1NFW0_ARTAN|nr:zinc finger, RING/FYVE/PHD-type [Artemisia annua]
MATCSYGFLLQYPKNLFIEILVSKKLQTLTVPDREYLKPVDDGSSGTISRVECTMNNGTVVIDKIFDSYGQLLDDEHCCKISMMVEKHIKCYESLPSISKEDICAICHEEYQTDEIISTILCKHSYHNTCIWDWLSHKKECPICRSFSISSITYGS